MIEILKGVKVFIEYTLFTLNIMIFCSFTVDFSKNINLRVLFLQKSFKPKRLCKYAKNKSAKCHRGIAIGLRFGGIFSYFLKNVVLVAQRQMVF